MITKSFLKTADTWVRDQIRDVDSSDFMVGVSLEHELLAFHTLLEQNDSANAAGTLSELGTIAAKAAFCRITWGPEKEIQGYGAR